jgi:hypothetical protein
MACKVQGAIWPAGQPMGRTSGYGQVPEFGMARRHLLQCLPAGVSLGHVIPDAAQLDGQNLPERVRVLDQEQPFCPKLCRVHYPIHRWDLQM